MMEIYLVRHGECYPSTESHFCKVKQTMNPPLTPNGKMQAQRLSEKLKYIHFDKIYCSDLDRAIQTAEIISSAIGTDIIATQSFREIDMGEIHTKPWSAFSDIYKEWILHDKDIAYPKGECGMDVWARCEMEIEAIAKHDYQRIAIICHGGTIRSIICGAMGIPQQRRFYFGRTVENCSISIMLKDEKDYYLHTFNDYCGISE